MDCKMATLVSWLKTPKIFIPRTFYFMLFLLKVTHFWDIINKMATLISRLKSTTFLIPRTFYFMTFLQKVAYFRDSTYKMATLKSADFIVNWFFIIFDSKNILFYDIFAKSRSFLRYSTFPPQQQQEEQEQEQLFPVLDLLIAGKNHNFLLYSTKFPSAKIID